MKYLRFFKIFEADDYKLQEQVRVLSDISLELCDENFDIQVSSESLDDYNSVLVIVQKKRKKRFNYNDIKDSFLSMVGYMESEGYNFNNIEIKAEFPVSNGQTTSIQIGRSNPVELKGEKLYLVDVDGMSYPMNPLYPIEKLVIKFKE